MLSSSGCVVIKKWRRRRRRHVGRWRFPFTCSALSAVVVVVAAVVLHSGGDGAGRTVMPVTICPIHHPRVWCLRVTPHAFTATFVPYAQACRDEWCAVVVVVVVVVLGAVSSVPDSLRTAGVAERSAGRGVSW